MQRLSTSLRSSSLAGAEAEAQQIEAARRDPQAFGALYDRHVQSIYRYLLSRLGDVEQA